MSEKVFNKIAMISIRSICLLLALTLPVSVEAADIQIDKEVLGSYVVEYSSSGSTGRKVKVLKGNRLVWQSRTIHLSRLGIKAKERQDLGIDGLKPWMMPRVFCVDEPRGKIFYCIKFQPSINSDLSIYSASIKAPSALPLRLGNDVGADVRKAELSPDGRYLAYWAGYHASAIDEGGYPRVLNISQKRVIEVNFKPKDAEPDRMNIRPEWTKWQDSRHVRFKCRWSPREYTVDENSKEIFQTVKFDVITRKLFLESQ